MERESKQKLAILGSTGSIGKQTLEVVDSYPELFEVTTLTANNNWELLCTQALKYNPDSVVIACDSHYQKVKDRLQSTDIKVYSGTESVEQIVSNSDIDTVVCALVGFAGLYPTINAIKSGKKIALANKESLVVAGEIVMGLSAQYNAPILPVDSEHSAIFQSLVGEHSPIEKVILTASGGPFREWDLQKTYNATASQALKHPSWVMGNKITIDSATMMNKGFEVIEAKWLFDLKPEQIEVTVHPTSIIHSMVQFEDGAIKCQMGTPDMKLPIQYALTFPARLPMAKQNRLDFSAGINMEFSPADLTKFRCLEMAYSAMKRGGNNPCVLNGANEVAVASFLKGEICFGEIAQIVESCLNKINYISSPTLEEYRLTDIEAREVAKSLIKSGRK